MSEEGIHQPTLLVIDDDWSMRSALVSRLRMEDYVVLEARNGREGLNLIRTIKPEVVLSDWMMPEMDGMELCRTLKADEQLRHIYFILVTGRDTIADRVHSRDGGVDDLLNKPIDVAELLARVRTGLRMHTMQQEILAKNSQLQRLNQFKSDMLAFASHELKTPIAVMRINLEMLRLEDDDSLKEEYLSTAEQQVLRLNEMVNTLLDLRRLEEGKLTYKLEPVDLCAIVEAAVQTQSPVARIKRQHIGVATTSAPVLADRDKLQHVVENLLNNAIKYSPEESRVLVQMTQGQTDIIVGFIDEGPGIPPERQSQLFLRYSQLQGEYSDQRFKSTGLGLILANEFIEGMGGHIGVYSKGVGKGSCFWIQLPLIGHGWGDAQPDHRANCVSP
ncbi:hybrid sensor histidine kinase/response regulator [Anthocerotibacter panamensis]|uniref:hybrid sensor histidine kinase/response regulator n=1 Tax=Anthocerotibacter panamensis TaxID=2857077 RepID=UPI001C406B1A|nr:hybrid sensor histidine kinase/response regulator [Anthocerotibacter panamensis]